MIGGLMVMPPNEVPPNGAPPRASRINISPRDARIFLLLLYLSLTVFADSPLALTVLDSIKVYPSAAVNGTVGECGHRHKHYHDCVVTYVVEGRSYESTMRIMDSTGETLSLRYSVDSPDVVIENDLGFRYVASIAVAVVTLPVPIGLVHVVVVMVRARKGASPPVRRP
jgi:hypothetical protein